MAVLDKYGLVNDGEYLLVVIPPTEKIIPFRILTRNNHGKEIVDYGPLPIEAADVMSQYPSGTVSVTVDGQMPPMSYTSTGITFPLTGAYQADDMWYTPRDDYNRRLFHVINRFTPAWLRVSAEIPNGAKQGRFQKDKIITGVNTTQGFSRGSIEMVHIPELKVGYTFGNDTNMDVITNTQMTYAEYIVTIPRDPKLIWSLIHGKVQAHTYTLPVSNYDGTIKNALTKAYGFDGFPRMEVTQQEEALNLYAGLISEVGI